MSQLSYQMIIRSNALQQTEKQCSSLQSVVLVCVSNSELRFAVLPYHIPVVGIHSDRTIFYTWVGNRNIIVSPLYSWRQNKPQTVPAEKEKTAGLSRTDLFPSTYLYHTKSQNFSFLSHVSCVRPLIWRSKTRILEIVLASVTREPTRPPKANNKNKRFVIKKKICHEHNVLSREKHSWTKSCDSNYTRCNENKKNVVVISNWASGLSNVCVTVLS